MRTRIAPRSLLICAAFSLIPAYSFSQTAEAQSDGTLNARELFYGEIEHNKHPATKPQAQPQTKPGPGQTKVASPVVSEPKQGADGSVRVTTVDYPVPSVPRLCVHANLQRRSGSGAMVSVDPGALFRVGDGLRLRIEVCNEGYLYVINRNTSGTWEPILAAGGPADHSNHVLPGKWYTIPDDSHIMTVEAPAGEDKLFVVLAHQPITDLQTLTETLNRQNPSNRGGSTNAPPAGADPIIAQNFVRDDFVDKMHELYGRDLVVEKTSDAETKGDQSGWFAATRDDAGPDSRVILDLQIRHN